MGTNLFSVGISTCGRLGKLGVSGLFLITTQATCLPSVSPVYQAVIGFSAIIVADELLHRIQSRAVPS
jgi:hypothetical protein